MKANHYDERGLNASLSSREKGELSMQAKAAYQMLVRNGATDEREDEFRHRIAEQACGRRISEAVRGDWNKISAAFLAISGQTSRAFNTALRDGTAAKRIAEKKLRDLLTSQGRDLSYAAPLFRNMHKTTQEDATDKQVWSVFFALGGTNAQRAARQKAYKKRTVGKPEKTDARW